MIRISYRCPNLSFLVLLFWIFFCLLVVVADSDRSGRDRPLTILPVPKTDVFCVSYRHSRGGTGTRAPNCSCAFTDAWLKTPSNWVKTWPRATPTVFAINSERSFQFACSDPECGVAKNRRPQCSSLSAAVGNFSSLIIAYGPTEEFQVSGLWSCLAVCPFPGGTF